MYAACQSMFSLNCHSVQHFYGNENGTEGWEENSVGGGAKRVRRNLWEIYMMRSDQLSVCEIYTWLCETCRLRERPGSRQSLSIDKA